ncbi:MAG: tRNA lysidine(34) synthetase TilS, partial [Chromatocurvus sp.]
KLHIECRVRHVSVTSGGRGLEAAARGARYAAFRDALRPGGSLLLAHHQDDQVETFFLRLMRGAGAHGLAGMPAERALGGGRLLRPLLALSRDSLRAYVAEATLDWIEDPSNADTRHDRNYLRHSVLPLLEQRWPGYRAPVTRAMAHLADLDSCVDRPAPVTRFNDFGDPGIDSEWLGRLPPAQAADVLRYWLREHACQAPPCQPLLEFLRQLRSAAASSAPRLQRRDWCLQRHGNTVYLLPGPFPFVVPAPRAVSDGDSFEVPGVGRVAISARRGAQSDLTLAFRQGGERLRLPGEVHHRSLKTLLQSAGVPPWWRERLPLLFAGQQLVAAGGLWRAQNAPADLAWERVAGDHPD